MEEFWPLTQGKESTAEISRQEDEENKSFIPYLQTLQTETVMLEIK